MVKNLPAVQETQVQPLGWKDPLKKEMVTPSSVLAWRIPGAAEPGGLPSMGSHRVGHDWSNLAAAAAVRRTWWRVEEPPRWRWFRRWRELDQGSDRQDWCPTFAINIFSWGREPESPFKLCRHSFTSTESSAFRQHGAAVHDSSLPEAVAGGWGWAATSPVKRRGWWVLLAPIRSQRAGRGAAPSNTSV